MTSPSQLPARLTLDSGWIQGIVHRPYDSCAPRRGPVARLSAGGTVHRTGGLCWGFDARWRQGLGSAHLVIYLDGSLVQTVSLDNAAWHSGDWPWNQISWSVELEAQYDNTGVPTAAQLQTLAYVAPAVWAAYGCSDLMDLHRDHVSTSCPGDSAVAALRAFEASPADARAWPITLGAAVAPDVQTGPVGARVMGVGDSGDDVAVLQVGLISLGLLPAGAADGQFGPQTEAAVRALQEARGLVDDGVAGPRTLAQLAPPALGAPAAPVAAAPTAVTGGVTGVLLPGVRGPQVLLWQNDIHTRLGLAGLAVDGEFGEQSAAAARMVQAAAGVAVDGVVGGDTLRGAATLPAGVFAGAEVYTRPLTAGVSGSDVRAWQTRMLARGWAQVGAVDGAFGPKAQGAADAFRAEKHLQEQGPVQLLGYVAAWSAPVE